MFDLPGGEEEERGRRRSFPPRQCCGCLREIDNKALRFEQGKTKADEVESSKQVELGLCSQRRRYHDDM